MGFRQEAGRQEVRGVQVGLRGVEEDEGPGVVCE